MINKYKISSKTVLLYLICGVLLFAGCSNNKTGTLSVPSFANKDGLGYVTASAERGNMEKLIAGDGFYGSLNADAPYFTISGTIEEVKIRFGSKVKKGDVIAVLREHVKYSDEIKKIEQELAKKSIEIKSAEDNTGDNGETGLAKLKFLSEELNFSQMKSKESVTAQELKAQEFEVLQAKLKYESALAQSTKILTGVKLEYEAINERYEQQKSFYEACFLRANVTGTCTWVRSQYSFGDNYEVDPYSIMATISDDSNLTVFFTPSQLEQEYLMLGRSFKMLHDGAEYNAKIIKVPQMQSYARYNIPDDKILIVLEAEGFNCSGVDGGEIIRDITLVIEERENVVKIPDYLLKGEPKSGFYVNELVGDMPVKKPVLTGLMANAYVEIIDGLEEGSQLII